MPKISFFGYSSRLPCAACSSIRLLHFLIFLQPLVHTGGNLFIPVPHDNGDEHKHQSDDEQHSEYHRQIVGIEPPEPDAAAHNDGIDLNIVQYGNQDREPCADFPLRVDQYAQAAEEGDKQDLP